MAVKRLHAFVFGEVQGVFFRANTAEVAKDLKLSGWVRNLPDGRVEVLAEGEQEDLEHLVAFLKEGPSASRVDDVHADWDDAQGGLEPFGVRR